MNSEVLEGLKFALSAYNDANRQSNRMWSAAAILAVLVFTSKLSGSDQVMPVLNIKTNENLPFVLIVLCGVNISYSVVHANVYRLAEVYRSIVAHEEFREGRLTKEYMWSDLAYRAPVSNFNRIYPLFMPLDQMNKVAYRIFKVSYDVAFCGFPASAIVFGLTSISKDSALFPFIVVISVLSLVSTALLMRSVLRWPWIGSQ
jgi:hypothetical protein